MPTLIVSGALANKPFNGGEAWVRLSWVRGLQRLGFDVVFVEQIAASACVNAAGAPCALADSVNLAYFDQVTREFGLGGACALVYEGGREIFGLTRRQLMAVTRNAKALINISGHLTWEPLMSSVRPRVYIDIDPGFTQFWHAQGLEGARLDEHDAFFTIGENIGTPACMIPTNGIDWRPVRQPVVLDDWPVSPAREPHRLTTVASWRGAFGRIEHNGTALGLKAHEFRKFIDLPARMPLPMEVALSIHPGDAKDIDALRRHGWSLVEPATVAATPHAFREYIRGSAGEWSVAQGAYVQTRSGWFSDRTVRYLASGKPALVQDTGFSDFLPVGDGLLNFSTEKEAVEGAQSIMSDYQKHCRAARIIAEQYFSSDRVLGRLLEDIGVQQTTAATV